MYGSHRIAAALLGMSTLFISSNASAVFEANGLYGIGGIGWGWAEDSKLKSVAVFGNEVSPIVDTKQEFMFRLGLGTLFTDVFGVELRYNFFNSISTRVGIAPDTIRLIAYPEYFDLVGLLRFEASPHLSAFVTLGPAYGRINRNYDSSNPINNFIFTNADSKDSTGWGVAASLGMQYEFSPLWGLRLEASGIKARDNIKVGSISGNVVINIL